MSYVHRAGVRFSNSGGEQKSLLSLSKGGLISERFFLILLILISKKKVSNHYPEPGAYLNIVDADC